MPKKRQITILLSALLILSLGCGPFGQVVATQSSGQKEVSPASPTAPVAPKPSSTPQGTPEGQIKYRQVSPVPPTLPTPPKPVLAPQGTPDEQAIYFADQLASGKNRLAVWMGVYDALGVPLIGQDGAPLGSTGADPMGPRFWLVWYASGLDLPGRGIPLQDVGRLFAAGLPDIDGTGAGGLLLADLRTAAQSKVPLVRLMGQFVRQRILRGPAHVDILDAAVTPDTAVIDLPTVQLISWVIIRSALFRAASQASVPGDSITLMDYHPRPAAQLGPEIHCSDLPGAGSTAAAWHNFWINKVGGGLQLPGMTDEMALPSFVELVVGKVTTGTADKIEKITKLSGKMLGYANVITSAISLMLQLQAMEIGVTMEPNPLIRTHETSNGKEGKIALRLYSDPKGRPDGDELESCFASYFLNALGVSFGFPKEENIPGAEIVIEGGKGIPDLVLINESRMRFWTGTDGQVTFNVIGKGQRKTIPDSAPPVPKEFSINVSAQPEEAGLGSMANIFFDGLTGLAGGAGFLSGLIDVLKTFTYDMGEIVLPLTDWVTTGWRIEGWTEMSFNSMVMTGGLSCDSPYGPWEFSSEGTTSQGGTGSSTFKVPFSEDGNTTATHNEHTTLPSAQAIGDWNGTPKVTITPISGGYRMDFGPDHMTGTSCALGQCQNVDTVKKAWGTTIVPADPGECPQP